MPDEPQHASRAAGRAPEQDVEPKPRGGVVQRRPLFRWRVLLLPLAIAAVACYAAGRSALCPTNLTRLLKGQVAAYLNGRLEIGSAEFHLLRGVVVSGVKVFAGVGRGESLVAEAPRVVVEYRPLPLLTGRLVVDSVTAYRPVLHLREEAGRWEVAGLISTGTGEPDPFPALWQGIRAEAATVTVTSESVFGDREPRTFANWKAEFKPFSCSMDMWEFDASLDAPEWGGAYRVQGQFGTEAESVDASVECPSLDISPEFLEARVPKLGHKLAHDWQPQGRVGLSARVSFNARNRRWRYDIEVECHDVTTRPDVWPATIDHVSGRVIVHGDSAKTVVYIRNLAGLLKVGNHTARPTVNGLVDLARQHSILQVQVRDLALAPEAVPALADKRWQELKTAGRLDGTAAIEVSHRDVASFGCKADVELRNCEVVYLHFPVPVQQITSRVEVNTEGGRTSVRTVDLSGVFCGGRIENGSLRADFNGLPDGLVYEANLSLSDVDLAQLLKHMRSKDKPPPESESLQGLVSGEVKLWGQGTDLAKLSAEGSLTVNKAYLWDIPLLATIVESLRLAKPGHKAVQRGWAKCKIRDRQVHLEEAVVTSGNLELQAKGAIGFDRTLALTVVAGVDPDLIMDIPLIKRLGTAVIGAATRMVRKARVAGTISEPKVELVAIRPFLLPGETIPDLWSSLGRDKKPNGSEPGTPSENRGLLNPIKKMFGAPRDKAKPAQSKEPE